MGNKRSSQVCGSEKRRDHAFGKIAVSTMALMSTTLLHMTSPPLQQFRSSPVAKTGAVVQSGVRRICRIVCGDKPSSEGGHVDPPKLEPFSQSRLSRSMRERSFLQKAEDALNGSPMVMHFEDNWFCIVSNVLHSVELVIKLTNGPFVPIQTFSQQKSLRTAVIPFDCQQYVS